MCWKRSAIIMWSQSRSQQSLLAKQNKQKKTWEANLSLALVKVIFSFPVKLLINFCFQKLKNEWKRKEGGHKVREGRKLHVSVTQVDFLTDQHEHLGWDKQQNDLVMWQFADKQSVCVCVGARTCFFLWIYSVKVISDQGTPLFPISLLEFRRPD